MNEENITSLNNYEYPLRFYRTKKACVLSIISGSVLVVVFRLFIANAYGFDAFMCYFAFVLGILLIFSGMFSLVSPFLILTYDDVILPNLFRNRVISWDDIYEIRSYRADDKLLRCEFMVEFTRKTIIPPRRVRLGKLTLDDEEVFHLIEQSFFQNSPNAGKELSSPRSFELLKYDLNQLKILLFIVGILFMFIFSVYFLELFAILSR